MSKGRDRVVSPHPSGGWSQKRNDASRAGSVHPTQREAEQAARGMLQRSGGGELTTQNRQGVIRSKDTIAPGNESLTRDKEH